MSKTCRLDNGRALRQLAKEPGTTEAFIQFTDGSVYHVSPVFDWELPSLAKLELKPGCWFNQVLRKRNRYIFNHHPSWPAEIPQAWSHVYWGDPGASGSPFARIHLPAATFPPDV